MPEHEREEEPIAWFSGEDAGMLEAIQKAQTSFPQFAAQLELDSRRIVPAMQECLVKYAFPAAEGSPVAVEHMFLSDLHHDGTQITGRIASEPAYAAGVEAGDTTIIDPARVSDWLYVMGGKAHGGFTFTYMWRTFSDEERQFYRDQAPFCWLELGDGAGGR